MVALCFRKKSCPIKIGKLRKGAKWNTMVNGCPISIFRVTPCVGWTGKFEIPVRVVESENGRASGGSWSAGKRQRVAPESILKLCFLVPIVSEMQGKWFTT